MSREKNFIKNTAIYMIGSLSSKLLIFLLLPIYTMYLTTKEYGYYDIIYTTVSLIVPMISLQIYDGIYRFVLGTQNDTALINKYISNALVIVAVAFLVTLPLAVILQIATKIEYLFLIYLQITMTSIFNTWQMIARGLKKNTQYAVSGIIMTATMLSLNILFIVVLHFSVQALIVSNIVSLTVAVLFLEYKLGITKIFKFSSINKNIIKQLIVYSIPLIPNSISWWILNLSNRYIISFYLGSNYNGIYAVASKFPAIIMMVNMVFNLAWQDISIYENDAKDKEQLYSKMFNYFIELQLAVLIVIIPFVKIFSNIVIGKEFVDSVNYIPILLLATFFQCFATFFCSFYYLNKKTIGLLYTTSIGAVLNILLTLLLIPYFDLYAPAFANLVSSIVIVYIREVYIRKVFSTKIIIKTTNILKYIPMLIITNALYYSGYILLDYIAFLSSILYILVLYRNQIIIVIQKVNMNKNVLLKKWR
jgi:O-antigen/teichoic acid export membrane protein